MAGLVLKKTLNQGRQTGVNLASIVSAVLLGLMALFLRKDFEPYFGFVDLINLLSITIILISLPAVIVTWVLRGQKTWFANEGTLTIVLMISLVLLGYLSHQFGFLHFSNTIIKLVSLALLFHELSLLIRERTFWNIAISAFCFVIIALVIFGSTTQSLFYFEKLWLGKAHQDPIFHMALSNIFKTYGLPSLGLHGLLPVKYHWASHLFIAQISQLSRTSVFLFYNLGIVVVFAPVFFKALFNLSNDWSIYRFNKGINIFIFATVLLALNAFFDIQVWKEVMPLVSESFGLSITLMCFYLSALIQYVQQARRRSWPFYLYSFFVVLLIVFTKVSTGMLLLSGLSLLFFLNHKVKFWPLMVIAAMLIGLPIYLFIIDLDRTLVSVGIITRLGRVLKASDGLISFASGLILFLWFWLKDSSKSFFNLVFLLKKLNSEYGLALAMSVTGLVLAFYVAYNTSDPFYFGSVQFFIVLPLVIIGLNLKWLDWKLPVSLKWGAVFVLFALSAGAHFDTYVKIEQDRLSIEESSKETAEELAAKALIRSLLALDNEPNKEEKALFLSAELKNLLSVNNSYTQTFIASALTGISSVSGIYDQIKLDDDLNYGLGAYSGIQGAQSNDLQLAMNISQTMGFKELIYLSLGGEGEIIIDRRSRLLDK